VTLEPPPIVGVSAHVELARWGAWQAPAALVSASYVQAVERAGGLAVLLPAPVPPHAVEAWAAAVVRRLDGLVLSGGVDVDPARYGAIPHPATASPRPDRDGWELALTAAALDARLPTLAICRGMQVLNVARGGTLVQHLPDVVGHDGHAPRPGERGVHVVRLDPASATGRLLGLEVSVPTYHHQGLAELGDGLLPVAWATDGTVEAVELTGHPELLAVQWHPEQGDDPRLFEHLLARATSRSRLGHRSVPDTLVR
jgi:putative glutamine amidotransferase